MLKISEKLSAKISMILAVLFLIAVAAAMVCMPWLAFSMIHMPKEQPHIALVFVLVYGILVLAAVAGVLMLRLLRRIRGGEVFTDKSVAHLRGVSWCCVLAGGLFVLLGLYFPLSFAVAFVAVFVGLCLRVVKNVLEEAVVIKSENDLTV